MFATSPQDLGRVRFAWSPAWETVQAVRTLIDPLARRHHESWCAATAGEAARLHLAPLSAVNPPRGSFPAFLAPPPRTPAPTFHAQLAEIRSTPATRVAGDLMKCQAALRGAASEAVDAMIADPATARDLLADQLYAAWERLVAPFWPRIQAVLDTDVAHRSRQLTDHGLRPMLDRIDPRIAWKDGAVMVDDGVDVTAELRGRGIVLMPSVYLWPAVIAIADEPWQPAIAYPARGIANLWRPSAPPAALARLLGRTRASLLARLDRPASTTTLARLHGLTPSGTSKHLLAMRDAGLLAGTRHGHEVRYERTRLGNELVRRTGRADKPA